MDLLLLPLEIFLEILQYLDYRALIYVRQTCKALHGTMSSEPFWSNIARDLRSKPGIGELTYPLGNYSTVELMRWTLHRLRARDRWAPLSSSSPSSPSSSLLSYDDSNSIQFHSRLISGGQKLYGAEILRGGRWLFMMRLDGTAHILDLEKRESPLEPQFLFHSHHNRDHGPNGETPLVKFRIWIDETKPGLVFRVATYPGGTSRKGPVYIYQIDCAGQGSSTSWVVRPTTIIRDPRPGVRAWTALSERWFLQCFALSEANVQYTTIQLHRCYRPPELNLANHYTETRVETNGLTRAFFVPGDRVMFMASTFINIYAISLDQDLMVPELALLHHVPILQTISLLSAPFVGSDSTFLVGLHKGSFRRITINHHHHDNNHDTSLPPIVIKELGELNIPTTLSSDVVFGPSASILRIPETSKFEIVTYEYGVDRANFRRRLYDPSDFVDDLPLSVKYLGGFDDSIGRIVLRADSTQDQLMVLDLI